MDNSQIFEKLKNLDIRIDSYRERKDKFVVYYDKQNDAFYLTTAMCILSDNIDICFHKLDEISSLKNVKGNKLMGNYDCDLFNIEDFIINHPHCCIDIFQEEIAEHSNRNKNKTLITYLLLYKKYPYVEQLMKCGFKGIIYDLVNSFDNKEEDFKILFVEGKTVSEITQLSNGQWKMILEFLKDCFSLRDLYYQLYKSLIKKYNATTNQLEEFYVITHPKKENGSLFDVNSGALVDLLDILKKGEYTVSDILKYIKKQERKNKIKPTESLYLLKDYIAMCDYLNVKPYFKPDNIKKAHDEITPWFNQYIDKQKEKENKKYEKGFITQKKRLEKYLYEDENLKVVIPESPNDLIAEGQNQHNCVAGYIRRYAEQEATIFFIRKKDNLDESYITIKINEKSHKVIEAKYKYNEKLNSQDKEFVEKWLKHCSR